MKKVLNTVAAATMGVIIGSSLTAFAGTWVQAYRNTEMSISINGQNQILRDATTQEIEYPLTYNGRTYVPLRSIADLFGYNVDYNSSTKTAIVNSPDYVAPQNPSTPVTPNVSAESMDASEIAYLQGLRTSSIRPTIENTGIRGYSTDEAARIEATNTLNSVYMKSSLGTPEIHSQTPFKETYENLNNVINIVGENSVENKNMLTYHVSLDSVNVLSYVYDSNNIFRGMIVTYNVDVKNNGEAYKTLPLKSLLLSDENAQYYREGATDLFLFCDFIE